jgi:hypothetical protein
MITIGVALFVALATASTHAQYRGILINGQTGTQLYNPFGVPHALGNLNLGLPEGATTESGIAVISGQLAYFTAALSRESYCQRDHGCVSASFYVYNTALNTTRTLAPMPEFRYFTALTIVNNGSDVLVCGGSTTVFDSHSRA